MMRYREFQPGPRMADLVARYWTMTVSAAVEPGFGHRIIPDGCVDLVVVATPGTPLVVVRGPRATPLIQPVQPGNAYHGVRFWPDAGARVLGVPAAALVDQLAPAAAFIGPDADVLARRFIPLPDESAAPALFESWIESRRASTGPLDPAVRLAIVALNAADGAARASELAPVVGLGPRQLQRRFLKATGMTIKTYARIRRLRRSLGHLLADEPRTWSQVAVALGFSDHSHLAGEFSRLAGEPPSEIAAYVAGIRHVDVVP